MTRLGRAVHHMLLHKEVLGTRLTNKIPNGFLFRIASFTRADNILNTWMTLSWPGNYYVIMLWNNYSETQDNEIEFRFLVLDCLILHSTPQVVQSSEPAPATSEIVSSIPTSDLWHLCEDIYVSQRSADCRRFTLGTPVVNVDISNSARAVFHCSYHVSVIVKLNKNYHNDKWIT